MQRVGSQCRPEAGEPAVKSWLAGIAAELQQQKAEQNKRLLNAARRRNLTAAFNTAPGGAGSIADLTPRRSQSPRLSPPRASSRERRYMTAVASPSPPPPQAAAVGASGGVRSPSLPPMPPQHPTAGGGSAAAGSSSTTPPAAAAATAPPGGRLSSAGAGSPGKDEVRLLRSHLSLLEDEWDSERCSMERELEALRAHNAAAVAQHQQRQQLLPPAVGDDAGAMSVALQRGPPAASPPPLPPPATVNRAASSLRSSPSVSPPRTGIAAAAIAAAAGGVRPRVPRLPLPPHGAVGAHAAAPGTSPATPSGLVGFGAGAGGNTRGHAPAVLTPRLSVRDDLDHATPPSAPPPPHREHSVLSDAVLLVRSDDVSDALTASYEALGHAMFTWWAEAAGGIVDEYHAALASATDAEKQRAVEVDRLTEELAERNARLVVEAAANADLKDTVADLEAAVAAKAEEVARLDAAVEQAEDARASLTEQLTTAEQLVRDADVKIEAMEDDATARVEAVREEMGALVKTHEERVAEMKAQCEADVDAVRNERNLLAEEMMEFTQKMKDLQESHNRLAAEKQALQQQLKEKGDTLDALTREVDTQAAMLREADKTLEVTAEKTQAEAVELQRKTEAAMEVFEENSKRELEELTERFETQREEMTARHAKLKKKASEDARVKDEENAALCEANEALEAQVALLTDQLRDTRLALGDEHTQLLAVQGELVDLQHRVHLLQASSEVISSLPEGALNLPSPPHLAHAQFGSVNFPPPPPAAAPAPPATTTPDVPARDPAGAGSPVGGAATAAPQLPAEGGGNMVDSAAAPPPHPLAAHPQHLSHFYSKYERIQRAVATGRQMEISQHQQLYGVGSPDAVSPAGSGGLHPTAGVGHEGAAGHTTSLARAGGVGAGAGAGAGPGVLPIHDISLSPPPPKERSGGPRGSAAASPALPSGAPNEDGERARSATTPTPGAGAGSGAVGAATSDGVCTLRFAGNCFMSDGLSVTVQASAPYLPPVAVEVCGGGGGGGSDAGGGEHSLSTTPSAGAGGAPRTPAPAETIEVAAVPANIPIATAPVIDGRAVFNNLALPPEAHGCCLVFSLTNTASMCRPLATGAVYFKTDDAAAGADGESRKNAQRLLRYRLSKLRQKHDIPNGGGGAGPGGFEDGVGGAVVPPLPLPLPPPPPPPLVQEGGRRVSPPRPALLAAAAAAGGGGLAPQALLFDSIGSGGGGGGPRTGHALVGHHAMPMSFPTDTTRDPVTPPSSTPPHRPHLQQHSPPVLPRLNAARERDSGGAAGRGRVTAPPGPPAHPQHHHHHRPSGGSSSSNSSSGGGAANDVPYSRHQQQHQLVTAARVRGGTRPPAPQELREAPARDGFPPAQARIQQQRAMAAGGVGVGDMLAVQDRGSPRVSTPPCASMLLRLERRMMALLAAPTCDAPELRDVLEELLLDVQSLREEYAGSSLHAASAAAAAAAAAPEAHLSIAHIKELLREVDSLKKVLERHRGTPGVLSPTDGDDTPYLQTASVSPLRM